MRVFGSKTLRLYFTLFAGWAAAAPLLLMGQDTSTSSQKAQQVCMWNEAVCPHGNIVSIGSVATDSDMSKLDGLHDVKELGFMMGPGGFCAPESPVCGGPKIGDAGFAHIRNLRDLEKLDALHLPLLTDDALLSLSKLKRLREVRFEGNSHFTDAGLAHLQHLKRLQIATFYCAPITDRGILYLRDSTNLQNLELGRSLVTDEGAREIVAQFRNLRILDLQGTRVTNTGLADIAALPHLEWLALLNTSVTDQGILALRSVSTLRDLYITTGSVHEESITSLKRSLPRLRVHVQ
jgi:hypothetical protein